jgi:hypothetical protein
MSSRETSVSLILSKQVHFTQTDAFARELLNPENEDLKILPNGGNYLPVDKA